jgi:deoxyribodipyrimidine photo-lyase
LASNTLGWQWTAGCGADAAPYFRIFNPYRQGAKFDPEGAYVRRWVPELATLDTARIHRPAPQDLKSRNYPAPLVAHDQARDEALAAYYRLKS